MNWELVAESKLIEGLGWTLIHSIWQIAVITFVLSLLLAFTRRRSANFRYIISVSALLLAFIIPCITLISINQNSADRASGLESSNGKYRGETEKNQGNENAVPLPGSTGGRIGTIDGEGALRSLTSLQQFFTPYFSQALPFAVVLWLFGVAFFSFRMLGGVWQLRRYKTHAVDPPNDVWMERFSGLCRELKVAQRVKLLSSTIVNTPIAIGILKPLIIVPASVFLQIHPRELETIIAHELIHVRRYDPLVNIIQNAIEAVLFYHPGAWWMSAQIRREREFAADAAVLELSNDSHIVYAKALANLEEIRHLAGKNTIPPLATAANGGNLMQRIQRILQKNTGIREASSAWPAGLAFLLISAVLTAVLSFGSLTPVNAGYKTNDRKIAVGFVSIPPLDRSENPPKDAVSTAQILIAKLKAHRVPAIGFVQGSMISDGEKAFPVRSEIVKMWRDAGFEIGIGGFKHIWFYDTPYEEYVANAEKNLSVVQPIVAEKNLPLRYFSYPFLNTGKSVDERDRFEAWLKDRGLTSVKYTIDNNEWMYSAAYDIARNDNDLNTMSEIRIKFIKYMDKMFDHYEAYSSEIFGRDIPQTMVLTSSRLVADSADELFGMIEKRGYAFVPMSDALSDEAYKTKESFVGKSGISWFERWTLAAGKRPRDEPKVDENVQKSWERKLAKK